MPSAFKDVIRQLERQKTAIDRAIAALQDVSDDMEEESATPTRKRTTKTTRKRTLSAEARKRISMAQKKRWAAVKDGATKRRAKKATES